MGRDELGRLVWHAVANDGSQEKGKKRERERKYERVREREGKRERVRE